MRYLILIAMLGLVVLTAGCTSQTQTQTQAAVATSNEVRTESTVAASDAPAVQRRDFEINSIESYESDNQYQQPDPGYKYLIVDFTVINNGRSSFRFSPYDASLIDPDGYSYEYEACSYSVPGCFRGGDILGGTRQRGKLVYQVPATLPVGSTYTLKMDW